MPKQLRLVSIPLAALLRQMARNAVTKTSVDDKMARVCLRGQKSARKLVFALGAGLKRI